MRDPMWLRPQSCNQYFRKLFWVDKNYLYLNIISYLILIIKHTYKTYVKYVIGLRTYLWYQDKKTSCALLCLYITWQSNNEFSVQIANVLWCYMTLAIWTEILYVNNKEEWIMCDLLNEAMIHEELSTIRFQK